MRKNLPVLFVILAMMTAVQTVFAQRYTNEIFTSVQVTPSVVYGMNKEVLTGAPVMKNLTMDVYEPAGDVQTTRPLIIYMHTGSFLPPVINGNPTGSRYDSTVVEMCKQFARRGYVVAAMSYRLGWNPVSSDQDVRTGSLLQAVYRAMQDAKACVRYFREEATVNANPFRVDTSKIILGGQGTGGYIAMAYASVDKLSEINLSKFISNTTNMSYGFIAGQSYVLQPIWGDFDGYGGDTTYNYPNNHVGYNNRVQFVFNMGGALGDSSWLEAGDAPMVAFHVAGDPFALPSAAPRGAEGQRAVAAQHDHEGRRHDAGLDRIGSGRCWREREQEVVRGCGEDRVAVRRRCAGDSGHDQRHGGGDPEPGQCNGRDVPGQPGLVGMEDQGCGSQQLPAADSVLGDQPGRQRGLRDAVIGSSAGASVPPRQGRRAEPAPGRKSGRFFIGRLCGSARP